MNIAKRVNGVLGLEVAIALSTCSAIAPHMRPLLRRRLRKRALLHLHAVGVAALGGAIPMTIVLA